MIRSGIQPVLVGTEPLNLSAITEADTPHMERGRPRLMFLVVRKRSGRSGLIPSLKVCAIYFHRGLLEVMESKRKIGTQCTTYVLLEKAKQTQK